MINEEWLKSRRNTEDENMPILKRSFHNHIAAIREQFGIHIECGPGYKYYIADPDKDVLPIVERLSMLNMMSDTIYDSKVNRNLYLDEFNDLFRGNYVMMIINAIKRKHKVKFENPIWPLRSEDIIGLTDEFGLMRIPLSYYYGEVRITDESYKYPVNYLPEKYSEMMYDNDVSYPVVL